MHHFSKAEQRESNIREQVRFIREHLSGQCDCWHTAPNGQAIMEADYRQLVTYAAQWNDARLDQLLAVFPAPASAL